jgi:hypothetical protein
MPEYRVGQIAHSNGGVMKPNFTEIYLSLVGCAEACEQLGEQFDQDGASSIQTKAQALAKECALACRLAAQLIEAESPLAIFQIGAIFMISQICGDACSDVESNTEFRRCSLVCLACSEQCIETARQDRAFLASRYYFKNFPITW